MNFIIIHEEACRNNKEFLKTERFFTIIYFSEKSPSGFGDYDEKNSFYEGG